MARLPVEDLPARVQSLNLEGTSVHHLPDWQGYDDPKRLEVIAHISKMRGRDPRIANLAANIIKGSGAKPREYKKQAAALLKWVQDPKNIYYLNEPGERLQDPIFTIKQGWGDCDDQVIVLCCLFESVRLPWKLVIAGVNPRGKKVRWIQGEPFPQNCTWSHIYCMVGIPTFVPSEWYFCETTIDKVPLGWDIVDGDSRYLPEMERHRPKGAPRVMKAPRAPLFFTPTPPEVNGFTPAYDLGAVSTVGAAVGASMASTFESDDKKKLLDWEQIVPAIVTGVAISVGTQLLLDWLKGKKK